MKVTYIQQTLLEWISGERVQGRDLPDDIPFYIIFEDGKRDNTYLSYFRDGIVYDISTQGKIHTPPRIASDTQGAWREGMVEIA